MLAIKLKRTGKKGQAHFRLVISEKRSKLKGRDTDVLGWMNPLKKTSEINAEKVREWIKKGAQPTESVHNLLVKNKIIQASKISVHKKKKESSEKN